MKKIGIWFENLKSLYISSKNLFQKLKKPNIWSKNTVIILIILNLIVFSSIVALIVHNTTQRRQFNQLLALCDINIARNAYDTAETTLRNALPFALTKMDYMRILKRANFIAKRTGNYQSFVFFSERAFNRFRRDEDIFTLHVYSLLKNGNFSRVFALITNNRRMTIPESFSYVIYAIKYKYTRNRDILYLIENDNIRSIIKGNMDMALYEQLYNLSGKPVVLNNYLLSILLTGDYKKALAVLENSVYKNQIDNELAGLIFYDNKNFSRARDFFYKLYKREREREIRDTGILLLLADTLIQTGSYNEAYELYAAIISNDRNFSWIPYVNKDWINMVTGARSFYTEAALNIFQNERELAFLSLLKDQHYGSMEARRNQSRYIAEFWEFFAEGSMTEEFKIFFLRELYRMGRFTEIFLFTSRLDNIDRPWAIFFNALAYFSQREYDNALILFHQYYNLTGNWQGLYNIGIIEFLKLNFRQAATFFEAIVNKSLRNNVHINNDDLADVYLMLSLALTMNRNYRQGEFFLNRALEIGRSSIISFFLQNYYRSR
ncbi:MAG: tetratricopeptide repeat protein [Spirochaetes bacterium]|nr:tetratricopeptide repeat protein [Spirochaetota bacterium]